MSRLLKALKAGVEAFRMTYKGYLVGRYEKYENNNYHISATIWRSRILDAWRVSRKSQSYGTEYKTPYEAIVFAEKVIEKDKR
jgi:hypothetical protein